MEKLMDDIEELIKSYYDYHYYRYDSHKEF